MNRIPIVTAKEMAQIEKKSIEKGADAEQYMLQAGRGIAERIEEYMAHHEIIPPIYLVIGKGNNGGDAYVAGQILLKQGFDVIAYALSTLDTCSALNQKQAKAFKKAKGTLIEVEDIEDISFHKGLIIDGILGTGFSGSIEGLLFQVIEKINQSKLPVISIDIPSGLNGNNGEVSSIAVKANQTFYLGAPKKGYFLSAGMNHIGELCYIDFGLDQYELEQGRAEFTLLNEESIPSLFPIIENKRHKYEAGYVLAVAGSEGMYGAAYLCSLAALRAGAGIVRLYHMAKSNHDLVNFPPEIIKHPFNQEEILSEQKRVGAFLLGPGLSQTSEIRKKIENLLQEINQPTVIDADALSYLPEDFHFSYPLILTPHKGELSALLGIKQEITEEELIKLAQEYCQQHHVILVMKGACTFILSSNEAPVALPYGCPGMATAGSGDVLTGVIAALLATKIPPINAAILGVYMHQVAGSLAQEAKGPFSMIARDIIDFLPEAFVSLY